MSGGATSPQVQMSSEQYRRSQLLKERQLLSGDTEAILGQRSNILPRGLDNIRTFLKEAQSDMDAAPVTEQEASRIADIDKELGTIAATERTTQLKSEGFYEIPKSNSPADPVKAEVVSNNTSNKKSSSSTLDAQRAALGARRRQSLFNTSQSRSLLG